MLTSPTTITLFTAILDNSSVNLILKSEKLLLWPLYIATISHAVSVEFKFSCRQLQFSINTLLRLRAEEAYDNVQYEKYIVRSELGKVRKVCFYLISVVPPLLLKPFLNFYVRFKK